MSGADAVLIRDASGQILGGAGQGGAGDRWSWWSRATSGRRVYVADRESAVAALNTSVGGVR